MARYAAGTIVEGSSDPRTMEQNDAIRRMSNNDGAVGSQYSGVIILPDGSTTRDPGAITYPPARQQEITNVLNAAGKISTVRLGDGTLTQEVSGGYLLCLNTDGIPISYVPVSAKTVQTNADAAYAANITPAMQASGITHAAAINLAMQGLQTDGKPVDESYLQLMERWAAQDGLTFVRPSAAQIAAINRPAPAAVVLASGQGIAAVPTSNIPANAAPTTTPTMIQAPTFTQGAIIEESFVPAPLLSPTYVPTQQPNKLPATEEAAVAMPRMVTTEEDASVAAAKTRTMYVALAAGAVVLLVLLGKSKG